MRRLTLRELDYSLPRNVFIPLWNRATCGTVRGSTGSKRLMLLSYHCAMLILCLSCARDMLILCLG